MPINQIQVSINGKLIDKKPLERVLVQTDDSANVVVFTLNRIWNGVDISADGIAYQVLGRNGNGDPCIDMLLRDDGPTADTFTLQWTVSSRFTRASGPLDIWVNAIKGNSGNGIDLNWNTPPVRLYVNDGFVITDYVVITEQLLGAIADLVAQAQGFAVQARQYRDESERFRDETKGLRNETEQLRDDTGRIRDEAQAIKDSTEIFYDVQSNRVGFRRADEINYKYTDDLTGPMGPIGPPGWTPLAHFTTAAELRATIINPENGEAYSVGSSIPYDIYTWDGIHGAWVNQGPFGSGDIAAAISNHNRDPEAHQYLLNLISSNTARIDRMEDMVVNGVSANPFAYAFGSLEGLEVEGVWNRDARRIEF